MRRCRTEKRSGPASADSFVIVQWRERRGASQFEATSPAGVANLLFPQVLAQRGGGFQRHHAEKSRMRTASPAVPRSLAAAGRCQTADSPTRHPVAPEAAFPNSQDRSSTGSNTKPLSSSTRTTVSPLTSTASPAPSQAVPGVRRNWGLWAVGATLAAIRGPAKLEHGAGTWLSPLWGRWAGCGRSYSKILPCARWRCQRSAAIGVAGRRQVFGDGLMPPRRRWRPGGLLSAFHA